MTSFRKVRKGPFLVMLKCGILRSDLKSVREYTGGGSGSEANEQRASNDDYGGPDTGDLKLSLTESLSQSFTS